LLQNCNRAAPRCPRDAHGWCARIAAPDAHCQDLAFLHSEVAYRSKVIHVRYGALQLINDEFTSWDML
jgi:hypothetical protein